MKYRQWINMNRASMAGTRQASVLSCPMSVNDTSRALPHGLNRGVVRPGYTLVHVLLIVTLLAVLLSASTSSLFSLIRAHRSVRQQTLWNTSLWRLSRQFRRDVHAARSADLGRSAQGADDADRLVLQLANQRRVEYSADTGRIVRTASQGASAARRESFRVPDASRASWYGERLEDQRIVGLLLPRAAGGAASESQAVLQTVPLTAVLGRDLRFVRKREIDE